MPRSGTNFLSNLLQLHPDCAAPYPVWEDFLITHADILARYSDTVAARWDPEWGVKQETQEALDMSLGKGLASFLQDRCSGMRVVSKTPRVENIGLFLRFFPSAKLIILLRDGRSVIESGIRTFGWHREAALHTLADAVRAVVNFESASAEHRQQFRIIRYEDFYQNTESSLRDLFSFLELDFQGYDLQSALDLPVRGSSELKSASADSMHWHPVERTRTFDPMSRFSDWNDARHYRYNSVAGQSMQKFGYSCKKVKDPAGLYRMQGFFLDIAWKLKVLLRPLYRKVFRE